MKNSFTIPIVIAAAPMFLAVATILLILLIHFCFGLEVENIPPPKLVGYTTIHTSLRLTKFLDIM
jgi:hypothetical protein